MKKDIIFISGFMVSEALAKTRFVWNDNIWKNYNRIYLSSKVPISDFMVREELNRLANIINQYPDAILAGHSLGGWWAANLLCYSNINVSKFVLWTPLSNVDPFPIFNVSPVYHPLYKAPNKNVGLQKSIIFYARNDLVVPYLEHAQHLQELFKCSSYPLSGGHFYQRDHANALLYMKDWIELD